MNRLLGRSMLRIVVIVLFGAMAAQHPQTRSSDKVAILRVPHGGIQPQVAIDGKGTLHLIARRHT